MASFVPGTDVRVKTDEPQLDVLIDAQRRLPPGKHQFRLVVTDDSGNASEPAVVTVIVRDDQRPTAVIDFLDEQGRRLPDSTLSISVGQRFSLSAARSFDPEGAVVSYEWELLSP